MWCQSSYQWILNFSRVKVKKGTTLNLQYGGLREPALPSKPNKNTNHGNLWKDWNHFPQRVLENTDSSGSK